jgi:putative SOS response-associated peptidase YedK
MCGRFAFYSPAEATAALFGVAGAPQVEPRYNIAPTQDIAAIRRDRAGVRELVLLRWGLVPFWAKDASIGNRMINARSETAAEKPAYRAAFSHRRCIVPADGFYEWRRVGDEKTPYFISLESGEPFAIAALWERWVDKDTGEELQTATLLTTAANEFMSRLHDRMPVILDPAAADGWLDGSAVDVADGTAPPALRAWPVRRRVNNARNEGSDLIEADSGTVAD